MITKKLFRCTLLVLVAYHGLLAETSGIVEAPYQPDYAKSLPERRLWAEVRENFLRREYPKILKSHGLRLNCGSCTTVYMDLALSITLAGEARIHSIEKMKACGGEFSAKLEKDFTNFARSYPYPLGLRGTSVSLRLGTGLKC